MKTLMQNQINLVNGGSVLNTVSGVVVTCLALSNLYSLIAEKESIEYKIAQGATAAVEGFVACLLLDRPFRKEVRAYANS